MYIFLLLTTVLTWDSCESRSKSPWPSYGPVLITPHPKTKDYYLLVQPKNTPSYDPKTTVEIFKSMELPSDQMPFATETASIITKSFGEKKPQAPEVAEAVAPETPELNKEGVLLRPETLAGLRALFPPKKPAGNDSDALVFTDDKFVLRAKQINIFVDDPGIVHVMSKRFKAPVMPPFKQAEKSEENGTFIKGLNIFKKLYNSF